MALKVDGDIDRRGTRGPQEPGAACKLEHTAVAFGAADV
jgi:hypothetical protein